MKKYSNPIFPSILKDNLIIYKALPSSMTDKIIGIGFTRRWISKPVFQNKINSDSSFVIVMVLEGEGIYTDHHGKPHTVLPGNGFQRIPNKGHTYQIAKDQNYSEFFLHIPKLFYKEIKNYGGSNESFPILHPELDLKYLERILQLAYKMNNANDQQLSIILMEICTIMLEIMQKSEDKKIPSYHQKIIQEACKILNENVKENILLPELANSFNISYERFRKVFKEVMGIAPGVYKIKARIQHAQTLLLKREQNINEIAQIMGYPDACSFSKQFKKEIGVSPEIFLKNLFG
ncbi:MAG: hypothetical protein COA79_06610 [Planctomycetota bacterium]|nr:MAG: hypothetical protein COA79_06610 [Planctomycetota bacterium]